MYEELDDVLLLKILLILKMQPTKTKAKPVQKINTTNRSSMGFHF